MTTTLRAALADYLALRRGLGYGLVRDEKLLDQLLDWLEPQGRERITVADALAWVWLPEAASASWLRMRMRVVRGFAGYLHTVDPAQEVPPPGLVSGRVDRAVPYLYCDTEIAALMAAADHLSTPLRRATVATLIGLLAVTGMRLGEVIGLDDTDFDPEHGLLIVRHAKLGKHRLLPLHPSTVTAVNTYRRLRDDTFPQAVSTALLVSQAGTRLLNFNVGQTFARLARQAGLAPRSPRCRPRPHDLRHTFAVNTLLDWYRDGGDVAARLPLLSTYLGHVAPANTYWYLEAAPELLAQAVDRLETGGVEDGDRR
jgi:integrase/recombinase XerD